MERPRDQSQTDGVPRVGLGPVRYGLYRPGHPVVHDGDPKGGLHADGPVQGIVGKDGRDTPRAEKRVVADTYDDRMAVRTVV